MPGYAPGFLFADVKETNGEEVISLFSADMYDKAGFDTSKIRGDYFMIIENKPVYAVEPLSDILQTINKTIMKTKNYQAAITVHATQEKSYEAITQVRDWWANDINGETENLNDMFTIHFGDTYVTFKITEAVPSKKNYLAGHGFLPAFSE